MNQVMSMILPSSSVNTKAYAHEVIILTESLLSEVNDLGRSEVLLILPLQLQSSMITSTVLCFATWKDVSAAAQKVLPSEGMEICLEGVCLIQRKQKRFSSSSTKLMTTSHFFSFSSFFSLSNLYAVVSIFSWH